jgi:hypothetical protein
MAECDSLARENVNGMIIDRIELSVSQLTCVISNTCKLSSYDTVNFLCIRQFCLHLCTILIVGRETVLEYRIIYFLFFLLFHHIVSYIFLSL